MSDCPKCSKRALTPTLLAPGLSAKGCHSCSGVLVDLLSYRAWADQKGIDSVEDVSATVREIEDTENAISCPNCSSVMIKYRLSKSADNMLDFCERCDVTWLDGGEWGQLSDVGLQHSLGTVFTEPWQRKVRSELSQQIRESVLRERFGQDYERLKEFRDWLHSHPKFESILAWIGNRNDV